MKKATEQDIKVSAITSKLAIATFFNFLLTDLNLAFHPDTPFEDYEKADGTKVLQTQAAIDELNAVMAMCFDLCNEKEWDIYEIAINTTHVVFMDAWEKELNDLDGEVDNADEILRKHHDAQQEYFRTFGLPEGGDPQINYDNAYRLIAFDTPLDEFRGMKKVITDKTYISEFFFDINGDKAWGDDQASRMVALHVYDNGGYIEEDTPGQFTLPLESSEYVETLEELEVRLFEYLKDEVID